MNSDAHLEAPAHPRGLARLRPRAPALRGGKASRLCLAALLAAALLAVAPRHTSAQTLPIPLDTVRVTITSIASAEMATATRGVQVVTAAEIAQLPAQTLPEVLQWALGVDLMPRSPALVDVAVRGSSFEQVLVMVDGVRVSDSQTGHFDLDLAVPLAQVERVEILRGPGSALHGADAVGGVINIVTRQRGRSGARVSAGSFGAASAAFAHTVSSGGARFDLGADLRRSDGHRPGTDYETVQGRVAAVAPLAGRTIDADLAWAMKDFGARGFYGSNASWDEFEKTRTTSVSVALRPAATDVIAVEPVLSFRRHHDDFVLRRDDPSFYQNLHTTDQFGGKITGRYAPAAAVRLAAGGEAYRDRIESGSLGDREEDRAALLGELVAGHVGRFTAALGARVDWYDTHGSHLSPSASLAWWPLTGFRLRGSLGSALRTPTWTERYYRDPANEGSPDLEPERSWSGEVGLDLNPAPGLRIGVAVFQRRAEDLIDWARPSGSQDVWVTRNVESARFRGIEADLTIADALGNRWVAQGSWLAVRSSTPDGLESKYALRPLAESLTAGLDRELPGGFGLALRATRARRVAEPAYLRADLRAWFERSGFRVFADVHNAADESYLDITQVRAAGRSLAVGVEWGR